MPHNTFKETSPLIQWIIGEKTRLDNNNITKDSVFHESFNYSPTHIPSLIPSSLVTMPKLKKKFGSNWNPIIAPLNDFERQCKEEWGSRGVSCTLKNIRTSHANIKTIVVSSSGYPVVPITQATNLSRNSSLESDRESFKWYTVSVHLAVRNKSRAVVRFRFEYE